MGHPYNLQPMPHVPATLATFLINNHCDAAGSDFAAEVRDLERQVIDWFARLWGGADPTGLAGAVVASGTEGNIWAIHLGREALPEAVLLHGQRRIPRSRGRPRLLRIDTRAVARTPAGEIDLAD